MDVASFFNGIRTGVRVFPALARVLSPSSTARS
jgi:hypothetical protein